jgi:hypothetical protein
MTKNVGNQKSSKNGILKTTTKGVVSLLWKYVLFCKSKNTSHKK